MLVVELLGHTPNPESLIAAAARLCYSDSHIADLLTNLTPEKTTAFIEKLSNLGHESPMEHVSFTFGVEGVSRALLAQLTRHRIASYSVQSQRYVSKRDFAYITPPSIAQHPVALAKYKQTMQSIGNAYEELTKLLVKEHTQALVAQGKEEAKARKEAEKMAIEDARFVLPNACDTKIVMTMNIRSLLHFFELRCCNRAQWEIHALADEMLKLVVGVAPGLFRHAGPGCVTGPCPEGAMTCGKITVVRQKYHAITQPGGH